MAPYRFALPESLIARHPPRERDGGRLLVLGPPREHRRIEDLPALLQPGDLLVVNDTRVMRARVFARRATGGRVEALLLGPGPGPIEALLRPGRKLRAGEVLSVEGGGALTLLARTEGGRWQVRCDPEPLDLMERSGHVPLPPYLNRDDEPDDRARYQTVFATEPGAVAAPTAGLHLSEALLGRLAERGVGLARVTLHVGPGTFQPLRPEDLAAGRLHEERYRVPPETAEAVARTNAAGGRVIAVGTTACRTLESAVGADGALAVGWASTDLFIQEGHGFRCVDGLLTNFHLPGSSLIVLVCAMGGRDAVLDAYRDAIERHYRFYSYGDAMLLL
ncbi:MAG: tRNA preQ1(34) S-adenosylmethionine ribosyltransferase-isomerase QueA [Alphaproteobacteria bacterium]|nr:tRNA preQ1(34) S-adenosylmethionine ribosyltransferase-isomerase QueA [Alphaproteobacteria bacterium]